jgi:hypothetical protein
MAPTFEFNDFRLETAERRLLRNGNAIPLAPKVFDTLVALVENPDSGRIAGRCYISRVGTTNQSCGCARRSIWIPDSCKLTTG